MLKNCYLAASLSTAVRAPEGDRYASSWACSSSLVGVGACGGGSAEGSALPGPFDRATPPVVSFDSAERESVFARPGESGDSREKEYLEWQLPAQRQSRKCKYASTVAQQSKLAELMARAADARRKVYSQLVTGSVRWTEIHDQPPKERSN
jgi:hypothetical protein